MPNKRKHPKKLTKREKLFRLVKEFIQDERISRPETIWQSDRYMESSLDLIEKCCQIVGYYRGPEFSEED